MNILRDVLALATEFLQKHQVKRARLCAETLLAHTLQMKRLDLYMRFDRPLVEEELKPFRAALKRAAAHEPIEHIMGKVAFYHCIIDVNPSVLIPRQETEILLDLVCQEAQGKKALDLCAGSGCLAIGLKKAHPEMEVFGVDLSKEALKIAEKNGKQNAVEVKWLQGDLTTPVQGLKFDLVICNPPYVAEKEYGQLDCCVHEFEPKMALVSGPSGYEFFERLNKELPDILNSGAQVFFEIGKDQGKKISTLFSGPIWEDCQVLPDWAGHDRFFRLKLKENSLIMN